MGVEENINMCRVSPDPDEDRMHKPTHLAVHTGAKHSSFSSIFLGISSTLQCAQSSTRVGLFCVKAHGDKMIVIHPKAEL